MLDNASTKLGTSAIAVPGFADFPTPHRPNTHFVCFAVYDKTYPLPVAFPPEVQRHILAGVFAVVGDYPVIRRDPSGRHYEWRQPRDRELFQRSNEQLDRLIEATLSDQLALARSPAEVFDGKKRGSPCVLLSIEGSDPLEGDLSRVKFFYD